MSQIQDRNPSLSDADYERKTYWQMAGGLFGLYTLLGLGCCFMYFNSISGLLIVPVAIIGLMGAINTFGLLTMSPGVRDSADSFLPLAFGSVLGGQLYEGHLTVGAPLWAMLGLMVVNYIVLFRTRKGPLDDPNARAQILKAGETAAYRDEYTDGGNFKLAGVCLLIATGLLYGSLFLSIDPTMQEINAKAAANECDPIMPIVSEGAEAREPIYPCDNSTNFVLQLLLKAAFLPGLIAGFGLLQGRKWANGIGDAYMGLVFGMSIFVFLAYESVIGTAGAILPIAAAAVAAFGLKPALSLQRGIADAVLKDVPATKAILLKAESAPSFSTEEYESWEDWKKTGQWMWILTGVEVLCLFLYSPDLLARISAALSDGFIHFPGYSLFSILLSLGTGALCAIGMTRHTKWVRDFTEMRIALGLGQVLVYLLGAQLVVSAEIWRAVFFVVLLGLAVPTYLALGKTRRAYFQS